MKHIICIKHNFAIFTIASTKDELKNNEYDYGIIQLNSHLIEYDGEGCKLAPVDYQKARNYDGS